MDIETDGSITPGEALASAGATLRSLVDLVASMSDEPQGLELGEVADAAASSPDLDLPIEDLDLSERPRNCLKRAQINTIGELLTKTEDDLLNITNFGQKSLDEVKQKLDERGLSLARLSAETKEPEMPAPHAAPAASAAAPQHQRLMMANLAASLFAAEAIVDHRGQGQGPAPDRREADHQGQEGPGQARCACTASARSRAYLGDREMTHKLVNDVAPRYTERNGGYTRILKLGTRHGDDAEMARIELV